MASKKARPAKKRRYHHGDLREALLLEGTRSVEREGHPVLSLRDVARRVGVTHTAAYHHFPTRESLLLAVAARAFESMGRVLSAAAAGVIDPTERLGRIGEAYVDHACSRPELYRLIFSAETADRDASPELNAASNAMFATLIDAVRACQEVGTLRQAPPAELGLVAWCAVHGLSSLLLEEQLHKPGLAQLSRQQLTGAVLGGIFQGLTA
ncbi:MAG TPA: TetR/AcrR family transcriptional regulator [Polyangiaceae bacterium]|nr:TetR/AcrR family transcriptional regulator [Polyangiaceae bacterium]